MRTPIKKITRRGQRGVSLFIVLIVLLLSLIVVLGGLAVANLNEALVGNQSDAQRAYGAAQALLDAAQRDIRVNGRYCKAPGLGQYGTNPTVQVEGADAPCILRYPGDGRALGDYVTLQSLIGGADNCGSDPYTGVCISGDPANPHFAVNQIGNGSKQSWNTGHDYLTVNADNPYDSSSDYANAARVAGTTGVAGNAAAGLLTLGSGATARGKYWVEIFPYNTMSGANPTSLAPDGSYPLVFRITAMAKGLRGNTVSVLRTYYIPYPVVSN